MLSDLGEAAGLALAVVFGWAAVAKFRRPALTRSSFAALGLPTPGVLAVAVPVAELLTVALLLLRVPVGASLAVAALVAFTAVLLRALRAGVVAPCSCFGSARDEPVSSTEVVRNLLAMALGVLATGAPNAPPTPTPTASLAVAAAVGVGRGALSLLDRRRTSGGRRAGRPRRQT